MPSPTIKQISYLVTTPFGDSPEGEMRVAYRVGKDDGSDRVLIFHPKTRGGCGSIEFGRSTPESRNRINPTYHSDPEVKIKGDRTVGGGNVFINLSASDEKFYRAMVEASGLKIPKSLVLAEMEEPTPAPAKSKPKSRMR